MHFEERVTLLFDDGVHELRFPMPYDPALPAVHRVVDAPDGAHRDREHVTDSYAAELSAFHSSVRAGAPNRTPPEQSIRDLALLRDLFLIRAYLGRQQPRLVGRPLRRGPPQRALAGGDRRDRPRRL